METTPPPLLSLRQAARQIGVARTTLQTWVEEGRAHGWRVGDRWVFPATEVARLQREGRRRRGVPAGRTQPRTVPCTCTVCGTAFTASRPARYCSQRCAVRARRARLRGG